MTAKIALLFPGQGSQRVGMGADLLEARPDLMGRHFDLAEQASGLPIRALCLEGPIEDLTRTDVAQPALFAVSMAMHELAAEAAVSADFVAGHSLGEYTAAAAAGALSVGDALTLVSRRGQLMATVQDERPGAMAAIIGLPAEQVDELCVQASAHGPVAAANLNTPTQIVVSGEEPAVMAVLELATAAGADRAMRLPVGAAFHSVLMRPVQERMAEAMAEVPWHDPRVPLVANASADMRTTAQQVREALVAQIASPVLWVQCIQSLTGAGVTTFLELGAGRVLSGLVRRISPEVATFAADSPETLTAFLERADEGPEGGPRA